MAKVGRALDPEACERQMNANAVLGWKPADILKANREQLLTMQHRLALGKTWGEIEIPDRFKASGRPQNPSQRIFKLPQFLPHGVANDVPSEILAWTEILRFAVCRLSLSGPRRAEPSGYSTLAGDLSKLKQVVRTVLEKSVTQEHFWCLAGQDEFRKSDEWMTLFAVVNHYHRIGALRDSIRETESIEADEFERDREDEPEHEEEVDDNKQWQPLPMEFVSEAGWRSVRLVRSVAPTLLDAIESALQIPAQTIGKTGERLKPERSRKVTLDMRSLVIAGWDWRDEKGERLTDLGNEFYLNSVNWIGGAKTNISKQLQWPPRTFAQAISFAHNLIKPAHLWMVLLGNGNRSGEVVSMRTNCLTPAANGNFTWKGRTFKMAGITGGREVKVQVPELIGLSILQQIRFSDLIRLDKGWTGDALWVGERKEEKLDLSALLNAYVDRLGLRHLLGTDNPSCHQHRFRKTLARLVALALTNSIMILKDCFGHTDAVMTLLSYIESDPTIAQEVIKVQKELTIMMAVDVITNRGTVGGPGAPALRQRADEHLKRIGKSKFDPQDAYEFARSETFDGRSWMLVAPGVVCTAPHDITQVSTPCAVGQKRHNPANCITGCDWQLLLRGIEKTQADDTVDYALKNLQRALDEEDEAGIAMWVGQAKTWLYRYDEVADKWKNHPLVLARVPRPLRVMMKEEA